MPLSFPSFKFHLSHFTISRLGHSYIPQIPVSNGSESMEAASHTHTHYNACPHFKIWPTTKNKIKYLKNIFYSFFIWLVKSDVSSESQKSVLILANDIFHCQEFIMHGRKIRSDNEERHRHRLKWKRKWKDRERLEEERKRQIIT